MKLFTLTHSYSGDGASQMLLQAAAHWTRDLGWQVDAVLAPGMTGEAHAALASAGMRPVERAQFSENYDLALINCLRNIQFVNFIYPHVPVVLWAHEAETILQNPVPAEKWKEWFAKIALVIFQTEAQARLYKKYISAKTATAIIPNGIPPVPAGLERTSAPGAAFRIVNLGKLTPMKGQAELVEAVLKLAPKHALRCDFIGDTEYLSALDKRAQEALIGNAALFGMRGYMPRPQALEAVAQADLFCFPSVSESFGLAPLEAAALGVPVVLSDLAVYKSIGWVSGENCVMFRAGDAKKLQTALETVIGDAGLRRRIAENGKALAARYDMGPFLKQISDKLRQAA